ncbi:hypothetical protein [Chryseobacterium sp.]|uniref:hypothetical protein n=1 Tax=Chryseobacterium sp. TaxID=1871047 RepID=UPI0025C17EE6|nr:hypothetical protein [Chryseobacterium sp.]
MKIKKDKQFRSYVSKLLFGIYFIALFSQSFHNHDAVDYFKSYNLKKADHSASKSLNTEKAGDCLACHFLATGNFIVPEEFHFSFDNYEHEIEQTIAIQERIWSQTKFTFQLRGPPAIS